MIAGAAIIVLIVLGATVVVALALRSWVFAEARTEARLHDPQTHTVAYAIPAGIDPVELEAALARAGFTSVLDRVGDDECVRVECTEAERGQVRSVIEGIHAGDPQALQLAPVVFEDER